MDESDELRPTLLKEVMGTKVALAVMLAPSYSVQKKGFKFVVARDEEPVPEHEDPANFSFFFLLNMSDKQSRETLETSK